MCGLSVVIADKQYNAVKKALKMYRKQKSRGSDGFGGISINDGKIVGVYRETTENSFVELVRGDKSPIFMMHHRKPTSTLNTIRNTHPIFVSHKELEHDYYVAHNGVIKNSDILKKEHNKLGYNYITEHNERTILTYSDGLVEHFDYGDTTEYNDSESFAVEIARYLEGKKKSVDAVGAVAFWAVVVKKGTNDVDGIVYGRNLGRTLHSNVSNSRIIITSENGETVEPMRLYFVDGMTITSTDFNIHRDTPPIDTTKTTYAHYGYSARDYDYRNTVYTSPQTGYYPKQPALQIGYKSYETKEPTTRIDNKSIERCRELCKKIKEAQDKIIDIETQFDTLDYSLQDEDGDRALSSLDSLYMDIEYYEELISALNLDSVLESRCRELAGL